jgi:hypothetical protein
MNIFYSLSILFISMVTALNGCTKIREAADAAAMLAIPDTVSITIESASLLQCPYGGSVMKLFKDQNKNSIFDLDETVISTTPVCNGINGANGTNGISAGVEVVSAPFASCPAGGTTINTFQDFNSNGLLDLSESIASSSLICNGINGTNGSNGSNAIITTSNATVSQCPTGGVVYSTYTEGQTPQLNILCNGINGTNGSNGSNAIFDMGPVGNAVAGKNYTACHHDYLYIPNGVDPNKGWLVFRHQRNGSEDQGIGSTGFNLWNVDIANFSLGSEVGNINYCSLQWNPVTRVLNYTVTTNVDGHQGENGSIHF